MSGKIKQQPVIANSKKSWANHTVYFFTIILLTIFPLFYQNYYFNILPTKYIFYYSTILLMASCLILIWGREIIKKCDYKPKIQEIKKQLNIPDICIIALLLIVTVSTFQSDFVFESFWGNEARYNGLFLWFIYGLAYMMITRFLKFKSRLLDAFLIAGILACLFGITDYFQMDLLNFKVRMRENQKNIFTSTFGNINLYTTYVGMVVAVSTVLFTTAKTKGKLLFYYIAMIVSYLGMIMGRSDNGYLAVGALFAFLPLYLFHTRRGLKRYLISVATLCTCISGMRIVNEIWSGKVLYLDSAFGIMSESTSFAYVVFALWILVAIIYIIGKNKPAEEHLNSRIRTAWIVVLCICACTVLYALYDANIAGNISRYGKMADYLVFNDSWGTDRGFVWKLSMNHYKDFSIVRKLFGYGPDTFGILMHYNNFDEMINYNNTIFESAHNEYIHYLLTIGLLGTIAYIMLLITSCVRMVKTASNNPYVMSIVFAIIAYAAQATVNIAQPIVTPIMFTLLMIGLAISNNKRNE